MRVHELIVFVLFSVNTVAASSHQTHYNYPHSELSAELSVMGIESGWQLSHFVHIGQCNETYAITIPDAENILFQQAKRFPIILYLPTFP